MESKTEKWKFRILVISLLINLGFVFSSLRRRTEVNRVGIVDVCLAQGKTKDQCDAIVRLIERSQKEGRTQIEEIEDSERRPVNSI